MTDYSSAYILFSPEHGYHRTPLTSWATQWSGIRDDADKYVGFDHACSGALSIALTEGSEVHVVRTYMMNGKIEETYLAAVVYG